MALCKTQDCSNSIPNTLELPQSCIKPSICCLIWSVHGYKEAITNQKVTNCVHLARPGPRPNIKTVFPGIGIRMLKIRRSWHRLIFNMVIHILVRLHFSRRPPGFQQGVSGFRSSADRMLSHRLPGLSRIKLEPWIGLSILIIIEHSADLTPTPDL